MFWDKGTIYRTQFDGPEVRDYCGLDSGVSNGASEKLSDFEYILNVK